MSAGAAEATNDRSLTLFVHGIGRQARESIERAKCLAEQFADLPLKVVDIAEDPAAAESGLVLVVPSLVLHSKGRPDRVIAGDLPGLSELAEHLGLVTPAPAEPLFTERALSQIWESNPDGVVVVDDDGKICFLNHACEVLLGRPAADLMGTPLAFHVAADGPTELEVPRGSQIATVELRTAPTIWDGRPAIIATLRDVTERKLMVDELRRTRAELARSNEDLDRVAAVAAHDLKTPLTVITGASELLAELYGDTSGYGPELVASITRSVSKMAALLDGVLEAARPGEGTVQPTDLGSLVRDVEHVLSEQLAAAGATLGVGPLPTVLVDPIQMMELFQNLISNAIKYRAHERPLHIEVSSDEIGDEVVISVADNGIGIGTDDRERVFTVFDRLPEGESQAIGHGIGLSICRRVVERHDGRIWIEGDGVGSTFKFSLPSRRVVGGGRKALEESGARSEGFEPPTF
jgi:signal transduction histidine kinase